MAASKDYAVYKNKNGKLYAPAMVEEGKWESTPVVGDAAYEAYYKAEEKTSKNNKAYRVIKLQEYITKDNVKVLVAAKD